MKKITKSLLLCLFVLTSTSCTIQNSELRTIEYLDIEEFMGDWYVIAVIPTFLEKDIFNAIENYTMNSDGTISTEFSFNKYDFNGEKKNTIRKDSSWIKIQMLYGGCSLFGQLKLIIEWCTCPMIIPTQSLEEINEITSG
ncbi:lipocalin family protein [Gammaproteobacteria bacterium]|nr:lipocalin family protein [Gammaproteobacteria bacterium]